LIRRRREGLGKTGGNWIHFLLSRGKGLLLVNWRAFRVLGREGVPLWGGGGKFYHVLEADFKKWVLFYLEGGSKVDPDRAGNIV